MSNEDTRSALPIDEFMVNLQDMHAGLIDMMSTGLRLQMLMLEDARNMLDELGAVLHIAAEAQGKPDPSAPDPGAEDCRG